jgi:nucleoside-diphosphate kinase
MTEKTLVLIKPDGVERALTGKILDKFESAGLKIVALKMLSVKKDMALKHYTEDLAKRRGEHIRTLMVEYISKGVIVAAVIEGVDAIEVVRKMIGDTEPKSAQPGTIRGDYTHMSFKHADSSKSAVKNVIHASSDAADAKREVALWFDKEEINNYKSVHEVHVY